jgi:DNA (cytosine-5)-methyltransferase 1
LIKYYGQGTGQNIKEPLDTVTARDRFGLVTIAGVDYQIVDIGLRMLEPKELYGCQGFPDDYIIDHDYTGKAYPRSEQVKRCGNAVCPPLPAALVKANLPELCKCERTKNMRIDDSKEQLEFVI